jgi:hypothetical protein
MSSGDAATQPAGKALTRHFALLSCIVIGLIIVLLSFVIGYSLRNDLLQMEWGITADYIRSVAFYHLTPSDLVTPQHQTTHERFQAFYHQTVMTPEIVRVKIYDATMAVVWSDEPRLVGERFPDNPHLIGALAGRTMVNLETDRRTGDDCVSKQPWATAHGGFLPTVFLDEPPRFLFDSPRWRPLYSARHALILRNLRLISASVRAGLNRGRCG